jgi:malonate transporter
MLETIVDALLPMVVTFLLGFVAAWRGDFATKDAAILNRMVLLYAVPRKRSNSRSFGYPFSPSGSC